MRPCPHPSPETDSLRATRQEERAEGEDGRRGAGERKRRAGGWCMHPKEQGLGGGFLNRTLGQRGDCRCEELE